MADPTLEPHPTPSVFTDASLKALIISILVYWGVSAVLLPVTTSDCQVYNLARLSVAERAGFWQAWAWNSIRQVTYPWTFDAVHYPFLKIGWGFGMPSFLAFLGLLVVIFQLVAPRFGSNAAFWSILTLLSMPTLMLQATTTKNDLVVVFAVGCWLYSLVRFRRSQNNFFLFTAALCLALSAGSKNLALGLFVMLTLATGWLLRKEFRKALLFGGFLVPLLLLFGSVETYVLSKQLYGDPIGPKQFVSDQISRDGVHGAVANFIRYCVANISTGIDGIDCRSGFPDFLVQESRLLLGSLGLQDAGCRRDFHDATLPLLKDGFDSGYDFGLVGFLALAVSLCLFLRAKWRTISWALSTAGFVAMLPVSFAVAWTPWNVRYFCLSFTLFAVSLALFVFGSPHVRAWLQLSVGLVIVWSAISLPLHCGQRRPLDLWNAVFARNDLSLRQRLEMKPVYDDVLNLRTNKSDRWFLVAAENSWTLPFLTRERMDWELTPQWEEVKARIASDGANVLYALVLNSELPKDLPIEIVKQYPLSTFIVRILPAREDGS